MKVMATRRSLQQGWGGYGSTLVVRLLEERGLVRLKRIGESKWEAQLTKAGHDLLRGLGEEV